MMWRKNWPLKDGASEGIRTLDTHVGNVMLYQAELRSLPERPDYPTEISAECKYTFSFSPPGDGARLFWPQAGVLCSPVGESQGVNQSGRHCGLNSAIPLESPLQLAAERGF